MNSSELQWKTRLWRHTSIQPPAEIDYVQNRAERENTADVSVYIFPSSFIGSPRAMKQAYQDAIEIWGKHGKPIFFLTFTCNPKRQEITDNILSYKTASDRPDIVARVFNQKKRCKELVQDIEKRQVLWYATARIHVIEFQKRGLPHSHMLIWIEKHDAPQSAEEVDAIIFSEIPDKATNPRLHNIVISHGLCRALNQNSPCIDGNKCAKIFPKALCQETVLNDNGYPTYRRRDTGVTYLLKRGQTDYEVDNRVPHNSWLPQVRFAHQSRILLDD